MTELELHNTNIRKCSFVQDMEKLFPAFNQITINHHPQCNSRKTMKIANKFDASNITSSCRSIRNWINSRCCKTLLPSFPNRYFRSFTFWGESNSFLLGSRLPVLDIFSLFLILINCIIFVNSVISIILQRTDILTLEVYICYKIQIHRFLQYANFKTLSFLFKIMDP